MKNRRTRRFLPVFMAVLGFALTGVPVVSSGNTIGNLRDVRYCEVIPITQSGTTVTSWVYNTLGLNACPAEL